MTANDHADCGSADSEFNSQVLLTLTGPVPQANEMNLGFGQLSLSVPAATMRTIPNPVRRICVITSLRHDCLLKRFSQDGETDLTVYGHLNGGTKEEVQIRISNEDMEDRDDLKPDDVFVEIERSNW